MTMKKFKHRDPAKEKIAYKLSVCNKYQCRRKYAEIPEHMLWEDPSVVFDPDMVEREVMKYKEEYRKGWSIGGLSMRRRMKRSTS